MPTISHGMPPLVTTSVLPIAFSPGKTFFAPVWLINATFWLPPVSCSLNSRPANSGMPHVFK